MKIIGYMEYGVPAHRLWPCHHASALRSPKVEEFVPQSYYKGRVPMLDDLYVLENSAGRDVLKLGKSLQGRAAGLHWLVSQHFRTYNDDVILGLKLTIDEQMMNNCDVYKI